METKQIEQIMDKRANGENEVEYLVHYKEQKEPMWEKISNLHSCQELVNNFDKKVQTSIEENILCQIKDFHEKKGGNRKKIKLNSAESKSVPVEKSLKQRQISKILNKKLFDGTAKYEVQWKENQETSIIQQLLFEIIQAWETLETLTQCKDIQNIIKQFQDNCNKKKQKSEQKLQETLEKKSLHIDISDQDQTENEATTNLTSITINTIINENQNGQTQEEKKKTSNQNGISNGKQIVNENQKEQQMPLQQIKPQEISIQQKKVVNENQNQKEQKEIKVAKQVEIQQKQPQETSIQEPAPVQQKPVEEKMQIQSQVQMQEKPIQLPPVQQKSLQQIPNEKILIKPIPNQQTQIEETKSIQFLQEEFFEQIPKTEPFFQKQNEKSNYMPNNNGYQINLKRKRKGHFKHGDMIDKIMFAQPTPANIKDKIMLAIKWKPRSNGQIPRQSIMTNQEVLANNPKILTQFYENILLQVNQKKFEKKGKCALFFDDENQDQY